MLFVSETTFARQVLRAAGPTLVCFATGACPARRALAPALERLAAAHRGRLRVATLLIDRAPLIAEQFGVAASPTLLAFEHGERLAQAVGFLPEGLLQLLADELLQGAVAGDQLWSPVEERFEDAVLLPLVAGWGCVARRQVACALGEGAGRRGRVDLLVYERPEGEPLTLIESKRQIAGEPELQQAARQALAYAQSLGLPSFVVAAPRGLWIYRRDGARAALAGQFSAVQLAAEPGRPFESLLRLRRGDIRR
jgi:thiol-disulfide isomerase/thioredoxin